jgi:hypothetical protein
MGDVSGGRRWRPCHMALDGEGLYHAVRGKNHRADAL